MARSKGEQLIYDWLMERQIDFVEQKRFVGLVITRPLPFDFFLPDYGVLIEYQGRQHYEPVEYCGDADAARERFLRTVEADYRKRRFADAVGFQLIRIKFCGKRELTKILNDTIGARIAKCL